MQSLKLPDGNVKVLVEGLDRARALEFREEGGFLQVVVKLVPRSDEPAAGIEGLMSKVIGLFEQYVKLSNNLHYDAMLAAVRVEDPGKLADTISSHLVVPVEEKQNLLEIFSAQERLTRIASILEAEVDKLNVDRRIQGRVKKQMERAQKEYYLNEKMKAIQKELGRKDDRTSEVDELRKKIEQARMPKDAEEKALQELKRLEAMPPMSAEATVSRNYLDWLLAVPWTKKTRERKDLHAAEKILNEDHYGLEKVKERIVEFLAVRQLVNNPKGPILCFVGPPGVGKTSLARSIARATNRKFVRLSLGGVRDEAEIRGHRRTYIGAFPGQIIQMMKKAGTRNPVFLLDEVDKMSMDFRGDPSAALLEVLDPEQNHTFTDHYLDVEFDLSVGLLHRHRQRAAHHPPGPAGPPGGDPPPRLHRAREDRDRAAPPDPEADQVARPRREERLLRRRRAHGAGAPLHPRGGRPQHGARDVLHPAQGRAQGRARGHATTGSRSPPPTCPSTSGVPRYRATQQEEHHEIGPRHRPRLDRGRRRDPAHRGDADARQGRAAPHRQAGRRDAGVGPRGDVLRALARRGVRHRPATSTASSTSTSTSPRAPSPRTGPRPGSRCARRSSRRSPACRCGATWR